MNELFLKIINISISTSWLILAILFIRFLLKKAPKWVSVLLWGMVAVRLLLPFSIESIFSLIPSTETIPIGIEMDTTPTIDSGIPTIDHIVNPIISQSNSPDLGASVNPLQIIVTIFAFIWIFGIIFLLLYTTISYWRLYYKIDTAILYKENIFQSEAVSSPFVLGVIKPKIYLPFKIDEKDLEHVIAHEKAHIHRKDHWWKPIGFLLLTFHWLNPIMWLAYILLCRDIELACDEKVIKEFGNEQRADYTQALLSCSVNRHSIAACPLAFGEVGVKKRVKSVMYYKKPTFWVILVSIITCLFVAICFLTNPKQESYKIKIVVPARSEETIVYSDEEIFPTKNQIIITSDNQLGDTEVVLKAIDGKQENPAQSTYLTPGMPVKMDLEQNTWFQIGVNMQNPTDEDRIVYVTVKNIEVRIASNNLEQYHTAYIGDASNTSAIAQSLPYPEGYSYSSIELQTSTEPYELVIYLNGNGNVQEMDFKECADIAFDLIENMGILSFYQANSQTLLFSFTRKDQESNSDRNRMNESTSVETISSLEDAISKAILDYSVNNRQKGLIHVESHYIAYKEEKNDEITVYLQAYESSYGAYQDHLYQESGSNIPTAITFFINELGEYTLKEYWVPRDGSYYLSDLQEKFPKEAQNMLNTAYEEIQNLSQECYNKALDQLEQIGGLELRIEKLLDTITSSAATSSNLKDSITSYHAEYQELIGYGKYTLRYCFTEFLAGGQTGRKGQLMCFILDELASEAQLKLETETGQDYFDKWKAYAKQVEEQRDAEWIEKNQPAIWILLQMIKK